MDNWADRYWKMYRIGVLINQMREGKGWSRGKNAATDGRIARNAAAHRGMRYVRHLSPEQDRRYRNKSARTLPLQWSDTMAYVVGLMATDGGLSKDRRHLSFDSGDAELVETFLACLRRQIVIGKKRKKDGSVSYRAQFSDVEFYRWLESIGLTPRKSLTIGSIDVPDDVLMHCARGLLDGDGSILNFWYDGTGKARGRRYENLVTVFNCASQAHLEWLRGRLARSLGVLGALGPQPPSEYGTIMWRLAYAIRDSARLLPHLYPSVSVPRLMRKWSVWEGYATRHRIPATLGEVTEVKEASGPYRAA